MAKEIAPNRNTSRKAQVVVRDVYNPADDYDVPHSGTTDPVSGKPKYDCAPVRGGVIQSHTGEIVNAHGKEIDPKTGKVLNPERYRKQEDDDDI
jgi:hypothetical protein